MKTALAVRLVAVACLTVFSGVALSGQAAEPSERILSVASRAFISVETLAADVARADVLFLHEPAGAPDTHRLELALFRVLVTPEASGGRRADVIVALDVVNRAAQEPLEHFQMGHLSDQEFVAASGIPPAYLALVKFAVARTWPIVATGPADPGGEDQMSAVIVQAVSIGAAGGKRPLLVSLHAQSRNGIGERVAVRVRQQLPTRRVLSLRFAAVRSLERLDPSGAIPPDTDYVIYTHR